MTSKSSKNRAKSRRVRTAMEATGDNYTRAAAKLNGRPSTGNQPSKTDLVREHIISVLAQENREDGKMARKIAEVQATGKRIISGGQTDGASWELHDWETSEPLARGDDGIDELDAVAEQLDPDDSWMHIDAVTDLVEYEPEILTPGLPASLCVDLAEWARCASEEDLVEFLGMRPEEISDLR